jgi:hypothetical protein
MFLTLNKIVGQTDSIISDTSANLAERLIVSTFIYEYEKI